MSSLNGSVRSYRIKRILIEAIQVTGILEDNLAIRKWAINHVPDLEESPVTLTPFGKGLMVKTYAGNVEANVGDYIICNENGGFHKCEAEVFEALYGTPRRERL